MNKDPNSTYRCITFHYATKQGGYYYSACGAGQMGYADDEGETVFVSQVNCELCKETTEFDNAPLIP